MPAKPAAKKNGKKRIQASDVVIGNRTLDAALLDLTDHIKANDDRYAERMLKVDERTAEIDKRCARLEEMYVDAMKVMATVHQDLIALNKRMDARVSELERERAARA